MKSPKPFADHVPRETWAVHIYASEISSWKSHFTLTFCEFSPIVYPMLTAFHAIYIGYGSKYVKILVPFCSHQNSCIALICFDVHLLQICNFGFATYNDHNKPYR